MRNKIKHRKTYRIGKSLTPLCKISIVLQLGKPHKRTMEILPSGVRDFPILYCPRCSILYVVCHWQTLSHNVISNTPHLNGIGTHNVSGERHYHKIMATTAPYSNRNTYRCVSNNMKCALGPVTQTKLRWDWSVIFSAWWDTSRLVQQDF